MPERSLSTEEFRHGLRTWFSAVARDLPWRQRGSPYQTWVSEVMLQQTRVDQALPYYLRFMDAFPSVHDLAEAPLDEVLVAWEGLGYYSRARNLHRAAQTVVRDYGGELPPTYEGLKTLPGVGDYTAAAVGSLAFGVAQAVLDGNVIRVLARYDAVENDVTLGSTRRALRQRAQELLDPHRPGAHNEALMELGATVCTPASPDCGACPVRWGCRAHAAGTQQTYPVKRKRAPTPLIDVAVGIIEREDGALLIQRRPDDGLLGGLWEFPGGKCMPGELPEMACCREIHEELGIQVDVGPPLTVIRHAYSHFRIRMHAFPCRLAAGQPRTTNGEPWQWIAPERLDEVAFPRANRKLIELLEGRSQDVSS